MKYNVSLVKAADNMCDLIYKNLEQSCKPDFSVLGIINLLPLL